MTAGMAYEALNHAGGMEREPDLLVILNDNRMSISENVGGADQDAGPSDGSRTLNKLREGGKKLFGDKHRPGALRAALGGTLEGHVRAVHPVRGDGLPLHRPDRRPRHQRPGGHAAHAQDLKGPQLLHVITTKGKGYELAEGDQIEYHAVGPFDPEQGPGQEARGRKPTYTQIFGDWLCDMAAADDKLWGSRRRCAKARAWCASARNIPERYFDVAIAEQHAVTLAAGMACEGRKPVVAIYSTFLQRGYDQLIHDVACRTSTCCSRSTAAAWSARTAPPTPAASTSASCAASRTWW
jgi:1-deoxy-D-xylulose-5-phosphate synthase